MGDYPSWMLRLVGMVEMYEETHGHPNDGWHCLRASLIHVPEAVRNQAKGFAQAEAPTGERGQDA